MPNRLQHAASPYLRQHADNPVDWHPWDAEALAKARREDKPIFLSIGYAACHWCHVMAHESFSDPEIAALMNAHFVNIKVDREERPDLDALYMQAVIALTGQGGWPMSVFLTPDLRPFYGGTYFPPQPRYGMPSFRQVLEGLARAWETRREEIDRTAGQLALNLQLQNSWSESQARFTPEAMRLAAAQLYETYDWANGGWGEAPKFPHPLPLSFLLRRHVRKDAQAYRVLRHALHSMARGGLYDLVGGGFHRYSTDRFWRVPHFEKMLYDNAQLARLYLQAFQVAREDFFWRIASETLDFLLREMQLPEGGFMASLDADSEGEEGRFYRWTTDEMLAALPPDLRDLFRAMYDPDRDGGVLHRRQEIDALAERLGWETDDLLEALSRGRQALRTARAAARTRPAADDKVVTAWNALALSALAEAARVDEDEARASRWLSAAQRTADFLLTTLWREGTLYRSWREGQLGPAGFLEDYAALVLGLLALYQTDFNPRWFAAARQLTEALVDRFLDAENGGFYDAPADEDLLLRPKTLTDGATPSGNALAVMALLHMDAFDGRGDWRDLAERTLSLAAEAAVRNPLGFGFWLCAADFSLGKPKQIAILGDPAHQETLALRVSAQTGFDPNRVVALSPYPPPAEAPALLQDRPLLNDRPTLYVCENFVCRRPLNAR